VVLGLPGGRKFRYLESLGLRILFKLFLDLNVLNSRPLDSSLVPLVEGRLRSARGGKCDCLPQHRAHLHGVGFHGRTGTGQLAIVDWDLEHIFNERAGFYHSNAPFLLDILVQSDDNLLSEDLCQRYASLLHLLLAGDQGDSLLNSLDYLSRVVKYVLILETDFLGVQMVIFLGEELWELVDVVHQLVSLCCHVVGLVDPLWVAHFLVCVIVLRDRSLIE